MKRKISFNFEGEEFDFEENTDLVNKLFLALGATLAEIQVFETSIIHLVSRIKSKNKSITFEQALEKDEGKTLGRLINELINHIEAEEFKNMLIILRDDRNYIVHNILRRYGWPIVSEKKYEHAIKEILQIREIMHRTTPLPNEYLRRNNILNIIELDVVMQDI